MCFWISWNAWQQVRLNSSLQRQKLASSSKDCITSIPHIRFHDLRHTFATVALQNGVDVKTVSNMLGHYDAGFTLRTYTHATRQMQESAAEKMGNFMEQVL